MNLPFLAFSVLSFGGLVLAMRRRVQGVFLFATILASYPLVYYITFPQTRYRHPIEPEMIILSAYLLLSVFAQRLARRRAGSPVQEGVHT
jgi:hypothetical protein